MRVVREKIDGPYTVKDDLVLEGMIGGDTIVASGSTLLLRGMVAGSLRVEQGAMVELHGTVTGSVENFGRVEHYGTVIGALGDADEGVSVIHPGAVVRNETHR